MKKNEKKWEKNEKKIKKMKKKWKIWKKMKKIKKMRKKWEKNKKKWEKKWQEMKKWNKWRKKNETKMRQKREKNKKTNEKMEKNEKRKKILSQKKSPMHYAIIALMHGSHGLSARRAWRTKSRGPKGRQLEVGARRAPRLLVLIYVPIEYLHCIKESPISYRHPKYHSLSRVMCHITPGHKM